MGIFAKKVILLLLHLRERSRTNSKGERTMAYVINEGCVACGSCQPECPVEAITAGDIYKINPDLCTECGACADVCPTGVISLAK